MTEETQADVQLHTLPRFQFVRALGRGVLGEAHEVLDEVRSESVVLKVFRRCKPRRPDQFKLDFEALARLTHPSLVRMHHLVDPGSETNLEIETRLGVGLAFTQEYVQGVDLITWLNHPADDEDLVTLENRRTPTTGEVMSGEVEVEEPVSQDQDLAIMIVEEIAKSSEAQQVPPLDLILLRLEKIVPQIVDGLKYLHRYHKVHGFLRPSNILVTRDGQCKLTDYGIVPGLVYVASEGAEEVSLLVAPEQVPYVAPEVTTEATPAGDIYALGTVLFEAVAGYPPTDVMEFIPGRNRRFEVPPLAEQVPECPAHWAECIDAMLRADPEERPSLPAIAEVMDEGRAVQLPPSVVAEPEGFVGQAKLLAELRAEAQRVAEQETMRFVLLEGASGVGKTSLFEEFAHWQSRRGWLVISGRCFQRESVPMQGWHEIARRLSAMLELMPAALQDAVAPDRKLASALFPVLSDGAAPDSAGGRLPAIRALRRLLGFVSQQRPILLCIEDLHWASWDTASLLLDLFPESDQVRALVIGTWSTDSQRSDEHFLTHDLELSLIDVRRLQVTGFTRDEAREFLIKQAPDAALDELRKMLQAGRSNPRVLSELLWEYRHERLAQWDLEHTDPHALLRELFTARMADFDKVHEAAVSLLAVASAPVEHDWLLRAVSAEIASSVLPAERTVEAMERAFAHVEELRLVRREDDAAQRARWVSMDDMRWQLVLDTLTDRDQARLAGRLADAIPHDRVDMHDLKFEYELRAGRLAKATKAAIRAARADEARFAYHRAAKHWRWLLQRHDKIDDPTINPAAELARVEHLAGRHAEAAQLYRTWAEATKDRRARAEIRCDEAAAWLQSGDATAAVGALDRAFRDFDESYIARWHAPVSERPRRVFATWARWNEQLVTTAKPGVATRDQAVLADLYDFALRFNPWLESVRGEEVEARLARLAASSQDATIVARHRMRVATLYVGDGVTSRRDRAERWLAEADQLLAETGDAALIAQAWLVRSVLQLRYGDFGGARASLRGLMQSSDAHDANRTDRRWSLYHRAVLALRTGDLADADRLARQLLHIYRGDQLAASRAYEVLAEVNLLRGEFERAAVFVDAGVHAVKSGIASTASAQWCVPQAQVHIALGQPEVAVGQLEVRLELLKHAGHARDVQFEVPLKLAIGQAAAAFAERQRVLDEPRQDVTRAQLRRVMRRLEPHIDELNVWRRAQVLRLFARIAMVQGKPRKALRWADAACEALGDTTAPLDIALCMEARGTVLQRLERSEARGILEHAWELYRHLGVTTPLVLEGWPVPRDKAMLKDD